MSLRFRVPCPGIRPLGSGPWELLQPLFLSLHPPRTLQEQGTDPRLCHHPLSVSPTSPSSAGSALTLSVPPLTPGSSRSLARNRPAKVCRTGYHPSLGGNTRLSAWLQRPLPGASRGRGGTHRSRGVHHREVVPVEEGGAEGAHERCHDQRAGPVLGKESKARQRRRSGATARARRTQGRIPRVRMPAVQEGLPSGSGPGGRGQSSPPAPAARLPSFSGCKRSVHRRLNVLRRCCEQLQPCDFSRIWPVSDSSPR